MVTVNVASKCSFLPAFFLILLAAFSCSSNKSVSPQPNYESFTVGAAADTIITSDGIIKLIFPANALSSDTTITIGVQNTHPSAEGFITGSCYEFGPTNIHFNSAVSLVISYNRTSLPTAINENSLRICKNSGDTWQQIPGSTVDTVNGTVRGDIRSFSSYGIVGWNGDIYAGDFTVNNSASKMVISPYAGITGTLTITSSESLSTLEGLDHLEWIGGGLTLIHSYYDSIPLVFDNGLSSLSVIGGNLLFSNKTLTSVPFPSLHSIGNDLIISGIKLDSLYFPELTAIGRWLKVSGTRTLVNLNGLESLSSVGKGIWVESTHGLLNLEGIQNIGGGVDSIYIGANRDLQNLHGLEGIAYVNWAIEINNNDALTTIQGFDAPYVNGITIAYNDALTTLEDLIHLSHIGDYGINIAHQYNLGSLHGLESVGQLDGNITLWYCSSLYTIDAPNHLTTCKGIFIQDCNDLVSLKALETITHTSGSVDIKQCNSLTDLSGLRNLNTIGRDFRMERNPNLRNLDAFANLIHLGTTDSTGGGVWLEGNVRLGDITGIHNLHRDPVSGYAVPGIVYIIENVMTDQAAWEFVSAIGGEIAVRDTIIIRDNE
jgi:hypothetical protein